MLNEVQIEGIVARESWSYDRDLFFRIASYRDAGLPAKPDIVPGREEPDYVNVRFPGGATSLAAPRKGMRLRVHGFLQSRDFRENLSEFFEKARKLGGELPTVENPEKIQIDRNIVEIVATRVVVINDAAGGKKAR
jgi:hypothetical protein